ncbi:MAG: type II toxin-antitoxin system mRNA interferase toxin, RelE/StbE family [Patescibacteria group bacterium]
MRVDYHRLFIKEHKKLQPKIRTAFQERLKIFFLNKFDPLLDNHSLGGEYSGCRSINVTGDYRAIFIEDGELIKFLRINTHHELYGK